MRPSLIVVVLATFCACGFLPTRCDAAALALFEVRPKSAGADWDRQALPSGDTVFVARAPSTRITDGDIDSVIVSRSPTFAKAEDSIAYTMREKFGTGPGPSSPPSGFYHVVTFHFRPGAETTFNRFASANDGKKFALRVDGRSLGYVSLVGPFTGRSISVPLPGYDQKAIREALAPLEPKTTWK